MEPNGITKVLKNLGGVISENSPVILTGLAVGGVITTVVFAVRATPKAVELIKNDSRFNHEGDPYAYTKKEAIKSSWKCYIPTACMGLVTIACIVGSVSISQRRNAALATVYGVTEAAFREYKEKVVQTIGKNKELKVRDDISGDHVKQNPINNAEVIFTGKGDVLCYDSLSGRYFKSEIEQIRKIINETNRSLMNEMWISLNELYSEFNLPNIKLGDELGWDIERGLIEVTFSSQLSENNEPCLVLNYEVMPKHLK